MFSIVFVTFSILLLNCCSHSLPLNETKEELKEESKLIDINNEFALNLLHTLSNDDNTLFSPISITSTLMVLLNGARGVTQKELRQMFNIQDETKLEVINQQMKQLLETIKDSKDLKIANRLLVSDSDNTLKPEFLKTVSDNFNTSINGVDFQSNAKNITNELNGWVSKQTNGKIQRLFKDTLDSSSSMVLVNAIYFHGQWKQPFDPKATSKQDFFNMGDGLSSKINMMTTQKKFKFQNSPQLESTLIELPFNGEKNDISLIILLPDDIKGLYNLTDNLSAKVLNEAINELQKQEATDLLLTIPKFKMETDYDLKEPLEELEAKTLFHETADLSGINGQNNLRVSSAIHKATVEFNEEGAEAAAGTGIELVYLSLPPSIRVDRPFLFIIRDNTNGLILFLGRVNTLVDEELLSFGFI